MISKFIRFGKPTLGKDEYDSLNRVMKSKWIGTGPIVFDFEKKFSKYKKTQHAVSLNSCTAGLHLSLSALGIKKGSEVITTALTFCSTINAIIMAGLKPVIADIRKDTFNINEKAIEKKITKKTKAILVVHFAGLPCNMKPIIKLAKKYNLRIIEDCAHAIETEYEGIKAGNFGDTGNFSFYVNKNITTGEGGMTITNNKKTAEKIKILRLHGMSKDAWKRYTPDMPAIGNSYNHYDVKLTGYKYNMTDLQASLGISQLKKIETMYKKRKKLYENYLDKLKDLPVYFQNTKQYNFKHAYHLFFLVINKTKTKKNRDNLLNFLQKNNIGASVHYRSAVEMSNYKKLFKWNKKTCPIAYYTGQNTFSLPLYPDLKFSEQNYIISKLKKFFKEN